MRWPWIREARLIEPRPVTSPKVLELQTAKEMLAEVFHARPGEVEEMIQRRSARKGCGRGSSVRGSRYGAGIDDSGFHPILLLGWDYL
jgi:hypothetical protein